MAELTKEEQNAINTLNRLAKRWPKSLWIYAADGRLYIMRKDEDGTHVLDDRGGVLQEHIVDDVNIDSSGGDW